MEVSVLKSTSLMSSGSISTPKRSSRKTTSSTVCSDVR